MLWLDAPGFPRPFGKTKRRVENATEATEDAQQSSATRPMEESSASGQRFDTLDDIITVMQQMPAND